MCIESEGLNAAVLNTSKMFQEIGDLYAKQVNIVLMAAPFCCELYAWYVFVPFLYSLVHLLYQYPVLICTR